MRLLDAECIQLGFEVDAAVGTSAAIERGKSEPAVIGTRRRWKRSFSAAI